MGPTAKRDDTSAFNPLLNPLDPHRSSFLEYKFSPDVSNMLLSVSLKQGQGYSAKDEKEEVHLNRQHQRSSITGQPISLAQVH